ncbi:MAG: hypothetical protein LBP40_01055 [Campylobacteraceae bacterium]|nr:hypothetical protein [Campylobacteraceae bacterium]
MGAGTAQGYINAVKNNPLPKEHITQDTNTEITPIPKIIIQYDNTGYVDISLPNTGNENNKRTMTTDKYAISEAKGAETQNTVIYQTCLGVLTTAMDVMEAVQTPIKTAF